MLTAVILLRGLIVHRPLGMNWQLALIAGGIDSVVVAWFLATGASIGSFINVVAYRVPRAISIIGPSRCPYCNSKLAAQDNFPILGWIRLRGRCRTCRLPIAARYLGAELLMLFVFAVICGYEFFSAGANLPAGPYFPYNSLEVRLLHTPFGLQLFVYLWVISGLVANALMVWQGRTPPLSFFGWVILPCLVVPLVVPSSIQVPWRQHLFESGLEQRLDAAITVLCGIAAGVLLARLMSNNLFGNVDHKLLRHDEPTRQSRQLIGSLATAGALLGWQAVAVIGLLAGLFSMFFAWLFKRRFDRTSIGNWSGWIWLAVLVYRGTWRGWFVLDQYSFNTAINSQPWLYIGLMLLVFGLSHYGRHRRPLVSCAQSTNSTEAASQDEPVSEKDGLDKNSHFEQLPPEKLTFDEREN
jgi:leader peptidase (prepilin peptidase) / N-methyltransferase